MPRACAGSCCVRHPQACASASVHKSWAEAGAENLNASAQASGVGRVRRSFSSSTFWEKRYARGGNSGAGSYGKLAQYKAKFLNGFVEENKIGSVAEFGCGDGNQLSLSMHAYPRYLGFDVSQTVLSRLRARFARDEKATFLHVSAFNASVHAVDLALSLDVIFHLVEDAVFDAYMRRLLAASRRFVVIYSSNEDRPARGHVRHRSFAAWMSSRAEGRLFKLVRHENNPMGCSLRERGCGDSGGSSFASFWVFSRTR